MTAGERLVLTTKLVAAVNNKFMSDEGDATRIGCFERSGSLITMHPLDAYDKNIKPQGMKEGSFQVPTYRFLLDDDNHANYDEADSTNSYEDVELHVLEGKSDNDSDTSIVVEWSVRDIKN